MTIYVLSGFNNYYNRVVKKFNTIKEYQPYVLHTQTNYNFVPNDNVDTQVVLGSNANLYDGTGDYLLVVNEFNEIMSRWFIIESVRDRASQYTLTLHRDLVADHYEQILNAPIYVEKATVSNDDPAIWNNESVSVNQIKDQEYVLKDLSGCAWIVGYLARDFDGKANISIDITNPPAYMNLTEQEFETFKQDTRASYSEELEFMFKHKYEGESEPVVYKLSYSTNKWSTVNQYDVAYSTIPNYTTSLLTEGNIYDKVLSKFPYTVNQNLIGTSLMYYSDFQLGNRTKYDEFKQYNNKVIKVTYDDQSVKYYKIIALSSAFTESATVMDDISAIDNIPAIPTYLSNKIKEVISTFSGPPLTGLALNKRKQVELEFKEVQIGSFEFTMSTSNNRTHLEDAPYDMFCIPYIDGGLKISIGKNIENDTNPLVGTTFDKESALAFAQELAKELSTNLLDLQLLPYCPLSGWYIDEDTDTFVFPNATKKDINYTKFAGNLIANVFYSSSSQGSINSEQLQLINTKTNRKASFPLNSLIFNKKIANECDMYRLCSPNYNGQFEFNPSKINNVTGFNVDYTYLPYSPYIHINPNFSGLYGKDFDDARGLICQGDFSISYLSDPWINYQIQNKNYANTFNRQIENMELQQDVQRKQQIFNAITGTIMGGAGGALVGSKAGIPGAIAGGIVGTAASAIGGALDVQYGDMLRNEALDYTKDMYNYQLDNIRALPNSIQKVTAYTKNNKIFPILEYYTCTGIEKKAIANKIAYNGMTVMRIGTLSEFINNKWSYDGIESKGYFKGKLIRLETIEDDYHIINALSGELDKGVFIQ